MGTVVTIDVFGDDPELFALFDASRASLHETDDLFSLWKPDSPMSQLRRGDTTLDQCPPLLHEVERRCHEELERSGGWFDPWSLPGGYDPTGLVKGWAAQRVCDLFADTAVHGVIVNAAGDIAARGTDSDGTPFRAGILDPQRPGQLAWTVRLDAALATSATYERGNHLFNPCARHFGTRAASASVTGPDLATADALATALVIGGVEALSFIAEAPDYEGLVHLHDGTAQWTAAFPFA